MKTVPRVLPKRSSCVESEKFPIIACLSELTRRSVVCSAAGYPKEREGLRPALKTVVLGETIFSFAKTGGADLQKRERCTFGEVFVRSVQDTFLALETDG